MKLSLIVDLAPALSALLEHIQAAEKRPPARVQHRTIAAIKGIESEFNAFQADRFEKCKELGTPIDDGAKYGFEGDNAVAFNAWLAERLGEDVTIAALAQIPIGDLDGLPITTEQMAGLLPILKDES